MSDDLTFAEAMALDPGEVEFSYTRTGWVLLSLHGDQRVESLRLNAKFRRARPKRSRVQEMAETFAVQLNRSTDAPRWWMELAIRAVCEYLRSRPDIEANVRRAHPDDEMAEAIERHFLEPR